MRKARRIASLVLVMNIIAGIAKIIGKWHLVVLLINAVTVLILAVMEMESKEKKGE